ncbi:MAG: TadE/TadG family type IV pilus assembly protein [Candidatus Brocadiales bacterium]
MNPLRKLYRHINRQERSLSPKAQQGSAAVEFALILPLFVLLVYGMTEFGRVYFTMHIITNAAREGAREAIIQDSTTAGVQNTINNYLTTSGLNTIYSSTITRVNGSIGDVFNASSSDAISVTVTYNFQVLTGTIIPTLTSLPILGGSAVAWNGTIPLSNTTVMRHE